MDLKKCQPQFLGDPSLSVYIYIYTSVCVYIYICTPPRFKAPTGVGPGTQQLGIGDPTEQDAVPA